jgi:dTDP-4-dehydrorhamnose reductase
MRALLTGLNGTVAPVVARHLARCGYDVVGWDRSAVSPDDEGAGRRFIIEARPDVFYHVATGPADWAEAAARTCAERGVRFVFTGSVSVFGRAQRGPFGPDAVPAPDDAYGRYKLDCERRVRAAHPEAVVARLGWQIGEAPGANHLVDFLHRTAAAEGRIAASTRWVPACAFLDDTARALLDLAERGVPGLYHLEGNPGLSFYEVAAGLNRLRGGPWEVVPEEAPARDNRMVDPRVAVAPITDRLGP